MIVSQQHSLLHWKARKQHPTNAWAKFAFFVLAVFIMLPKAFLSPAAASQLVLNGQANMGDIAPHMEYTIDTAWQLKAQDFIGQSAVATRPLPSSAPDFGYTPAKIWLKLPVINNTASSSAWLFFVHANFLQAASIDKISPDGTITTLLSLTPDSPFSARPVDYPQLVVPFDLEPGEAATLIVSYYSQGSSRLSMSIETPDSFSRQTSISQAKSYAFYGMMLVMLALVTVALIVLRQAVFAAFGGYLLSMLVYVSHSDGVAFQYIWPEFPRFNSIASVVAGSSVMVFGGLFAMSILQTARFHPVMHRVLIGVIGSVLLINAVLIPTDTQLLKRLLVFMISICTLTYLLSGLVAARTRFREVRFYVLAWMVLLIPVSLFTARFAFGFELQFLTLYDTIRIGLVFEALLMGLAIFDRYNFQRQSAMEESLAQAQKNLSLSQRLGVLEDQYQQVTTKAQAREESVKDTIHDLRQPMQALRLSLRQMFDPAADKSNDAGHVESALAYMERLVAGRLAEEADVQAAANNDLSTHQQLSTEPGVHDVLRGIADMFTAEAAAKGLALKLVLAAPDAQVAAYPLMRVVANLTSNAIKYTKAGRIIIALRRSGPRHFIEVHDTGPGLSGAAFEQALKRNQRLDRDIDAATGSGLGLSVVTEIAAANHWEVTSCNARTTGASIRITL